MEVKEMLLGKVKDGSFALCTCEQIIKKLKLGGREAPVVRKILLSLVREGELLQDSQERFGTAEQFGAKRGKISANERGFAFFIPDDGSKDLFLPHRALKNALHGDDVLCICTGGRNGDEGEVLAILARGYQRIVGTFRRERQGGYVIPDERRFTEEVFIPQNKSLGCPNGKKVIAKITSYDGRSPAGEIVEILGQSGELSIEELAIIRAHSLREEFPDEVLKEAEKQGKTDPLLSLDGRMDLRGKLIITVDGEDTRDIDDAISVEKRGGLYYLGVHIADVSHYVKRGSLLDKEAFARGTSVYFPDRVLPMLPPALSNGICSLNEGVPRLTLSCLMTIDGKGNVIKKRIVPSVICSRHRMTYTSVTAIWKGEKEAVEQYPDLVGFVRTAVELTNILKKARVARGGIELDLKEAKILFEDGVISIPEYERTISHDMIEQFMVLANESVAEIMTEKAMPFVYRVHEKPSEEKALAFREFLKEVGVSPRFDPANVTPKDYAAVLEKLSGDPLMGVVNQVMLRSMMKAVYSPENIGHFGLASACYCHFTSPIRRYPDLCIHRIIKDALKDEKKARESYRGIVGSASTQSSACERNAMEAERDVDALYIVTYMQSHIGKEYDAVISGVNSFGVFAQLANTVEGMIAIELLPEDSYEYFEERFLLRGTRHSFRLGQKIRVKVIGVDFGIRRVNFSLV